MSSDDRFTLIQTKQYQKCVQKLELRFSQDLEKKLEELTTNPYDLAKGLHGNLAGRYTVRFAKQTHRLIIRINWSSKTIELLYLATRALVYTGKMWE